MGSHFHEGRRTKGEIHLSHTIGFKTCLNSILGSVSQSPRRFPNFFAYCWDIFVILAVFCRIYYPFYYPADNQTIRRITDSKNDPGYPWSTNIRRISGTPLVLVQSNFY